MDKVPFRFLDSNFSLATAKIWFLRPGPDPLKVYPGAGSGQNRNYDRNLVHPFDNCFLIKLLFTLKATIFKIHCYKRRMLTLHVICSKWKLLCLSITRCHINSKRWNVLVSLFFLFFFSFFLVRNWHYWSMNLICIGEEAILYWVGYIQKTMGKCCQER